MTRPPGRSSRPLMQLSPKAVERATSPETLGGKCYLRPKWAMRSSSIFTRPQIVSTHSTLSNCMSGQTLYDKIWDAHVVHEGNGEPSLLYIDRHLVHEVTSPQAFEGLSLH